MKLPYKFLFLLFFLLQSIPLSAFSQNAIKNPASVKISIQFQAGAKNSSGFLMKKDGRSFLIMTTHALHHRHEPNPKDWFPQEIIITLDDGTQFHITSEEYEKCRSHYPESLDPDGYGQYVDTSKIDLTDTVGFAQVRQSIEKNFLEYTQLATDEDINNLDNQELEISSIYGFAQAKISQRYPIIGNQRLLGFQIKDSSRQVIGGDSGGLIMGSRDGKKLVVGMILKSGTGYAVDSIRIKDIFQKSVR